MSSRIHRRGTYGKTFCSWRSLQPRQLRALRNVWIPGDPDRTVKTNQLAMRLIKKKQLRFLRRSAQPICETHRVRNHSFKAWLGQSAKSSVTDRSRADRKYRKQVRTWFRDSLNCSFVLKRSAREDAIAV